MSAAVIYRQKPGNGVGKMTEKEFLAVLGSVTNRLEPEAGSASRTLRLLEMLARNCKGCVCYGSLSACRACPSSSAVSILQDMTLSQTTLVAVAISKEAV